MMPAFSSSTTLSEEELLQLVDEDERRTALSFGSARRRREFMMWRHIVRRELGRDTLIAYSETEHRSFRGEPSTSGFRTVPIWSR